MTLEILTDPTLDQRHGFFTRKGGVSKGIHGGLNCGFGSKDDRVSVEGNRKLIAENLGVETLNTVFQHHSATVVTVADDHDPAIKADAMVSNQTGRALGILTADCAPILFSDPLNGVIGAAHAGWKGALSGILQNTVEAMIALGADREQIVAVIGPSISQANYEVGQEFIEAFVDEEPRYSEFFVNGSDGKFQFDLPGFCLNQLRGLGISSASSVGACTYADEERFYSYRRSTHRNEPDYGRLMSVITL